MGVWHDRPCILSPLKRGAWIENYWCQSANQTRSMSPLKRGRGLKPPDPGRSRGNNRVAPQAGAWIETALPPAPNQIITGRPSSGGVD